MRTITIKKKIDQAESEGRVIAEQTIFGLRAVSTYFTFYKAVIPTEYWKELEKGLPKKMVEKDFPIAGLDIAEPKERREILMAFFKIQIAQLKICDNLDITGHSICKIAQLCQKLRYLDIVYKIVKAYCKLELLCIGGLKRYKPISDQTIAHSCPHLFKRLL
ncbi:hypothetical protein Glove_81g83 [Diversispora epigaea]|uniref:Uncharacterized protein n=1 Tax=Diversispora epigaea TaxID=1348612 RepID=A0A397JHM9_9GLOM|nr:hypothetical protein Glove_81g83 [Diversispora epigaea]